jgi:hypothetical protein
MLPHHIEDLPFGLKDARPAVLLVFPKNLDDLRLVSSELCN